MSTTRLIEYGGANIEASQIGNEWYVTIDGVEMNGSWSRAMLALDAAKRRVTLRNRRASRKTRTATPSNANWYDGYDRDRKAKAYRWAAGFEAEFGWWPRCVGDKPADLTAWIEDV